MLLTQTSWAHEMRPAILTVKQSDDFTYQALFKQPQVQGRFLDLSVITNCDSTLVKSTTNASALEETFSLTCDDALATIEVVGLERTLIDTIITVEDRSGSTENYLVNGRVPKVNLGGGTATPVYLILGVEHLFFGIDHVLFVLLLVYLVSGWRNLIKVVTSFTVAHSITLGLSAFNILSVSQQPVEALIALSIVLLAAEALRGEEGLIYRKPWLITFAFGLLHGLGFAGALAEIGLPQAGAAMALLLFNVGIEIGQLAIIAAALALTFLVSRAGLRPTGAIIALPVYLIGGVSFFWFIDRSLQVLV
ncbi:HupE/UreJ family protein [Candidatus Litorirhabdus singularis]|uniref:HupE/UreJ family protein n=1 Tax=Candidatus Litorirhabdus singularis TaxID=2518993 RepID=UPI00242AA904|nr:HupE/UreJ family protein [Candidatus Litorirhabdus singularis]